jgi:hypothetical protein
MCKKLEFVKFGGPVIILGYVFPQKKKVSG